MITVATHNVERSLAPTYARAALQTVLDAGPDLVGLQEWEAARLPLLRGTGTLRVLPVPVAVPGRGDFLWVGGLVGGCVVGARRARFEYVGARTVLLDPPGRADNPERPLLLEPPRLATSATFTDRATGRQVTLVGYHLSPGVQRTGGYRPDRPLLTARHRAQTRRLADHVGALLARGDRVFAVGDANFHGFALPGLVSAWTDRPDAPGTLSSYRRVDDVLGPRRPDEVQLLATRSDHKAVVARWVEPVSR